MMMMFSLLILTMAANLIETSQLCNTGALTISLTLTPIELSMRVKVQAKALHTLQKTRPTFYLLAMTEKFLTEIFIN